MPAALEKCVQGVQDSGKSKSEAYAICSARTGWTKSKNGWKNKKTGETYNENEGAEMNGQDINIAESFTEMFLKESVQWMVMIDGRLFEIYDSYEEAEEAVKALQKERKYKNADIYIDKMT